jgi:hypothetical protein
MASSSYTALQAAISSRRRVYRFSAIVFGYGARARASVGVDRLDLLLLEITLQRSWTRSGVRACIRAYTYVRENNGDSILGSGKEWRGCRPRNFNIKSWINIYIVEILRHFLRTLLKMPFSPTASTRQRQTSSYIIDWPCRRPIHVHPSFAMQDGRKCWLTCPLMDMPTLESRLPWVFLSWARHGAFGWLDRPWSALPSRLHVFEARI